MPTSWTSWEDRSLLNPAFCSHMIWHAAGGGTTRVGAGISFEESFLVLPLVLHRRTREALPSTIRVSLPAWLSRNVAIRLEIGPRTRAFVPYTRAALLFGGAHDFLQVAGGRVYAQTRWRLAVKKALAQSSGEVRACAERSAFLGRWLSEAGDSTTILALMGVRP